ncbi:MAG: hypothetical protein IPP71_15460 [Bacteroidetes bacterium]|nr:hypothetical protein [Bacteroidota bacterium]
MRNYFIRLANYNCWANQRICEFIVNAGEEVSMLKQNSSFSTIRETVFHIWDAESIWLNRMKKEPVTNWPSKKCIGSTREGCDLMVLGSHDFKTLIESFDVDKFDDTLPYFNIKGDPFHSTFTEIIAHVLNHSTFHRGQIVTMLRSAGFTDLQSTDLIAFYRDSGH